MCCYTRNFEKLNKFYKMAFKKNPSQLRMMINEEAYTLSMEYLVFKKL